MKPEDEKFISSLKANKIFLDVEVENEICKYYGNEINILNYATFYRLSRIYKLSDLSKLSLSFIERHRQLVAFLDTIFCIILYLRVFHF